MHAASGGAAARGGSAPAGSGRTGARPPEGPDGRAPARRRLDASRLAASRLAAVAGLAAILLAAVPPTSRAAAAGHAGEVSEPSLLVPGEPVEIALAGGETRAFAFDLGAARYARLTVEQRGIDVVAVLVSPRGETLVEADGPDGARGAERISALAATAADAGRFRLEVKSGYPDDPPGEVTVLLAEERAARPEDREMLAAERLSNQAVALWGKGDGESLRGAIARFEAALEVWRRLGDRRREAEIATHLGYLHRQLGELNREAERYEQALPLWREQGDVARQAELLNNLGTVYGRLGDTARGLAASEEAAALFHELGDRRSEAAALNSIGHTLLLTGADLERAEDYLERSLALRRETGDRRGEGRTLNGLGRLRLRRGQVQDGIAALTRALELARETGDAEAEVAAINNLTTAWSDIGEHGRALEQHLETLRLTREQGDVRREAYALNNIGGLYLGFGEPAEAVRYFQQALDAFRRIGDRWAEAGAHDAIALALIELGRPGEAVEHVELSLTAARELGDRLRESSALSKLARARIDLGDAAGARAPALEAVEVARGAGIRPSEGYALASLAEVQLALGETAPARERLDEALAIARETGSRPDEAWALLLTARACRADGSLDEARRHVELAVERIESARTAVAAEDLRATYLASKQEYYEEWIGLLMALDRRDPAAGWAARALDVAERARARTLLDALAEVGSRVRADLDPAVAAEQESLRHRLNEAERHRREAAAAGDGDAAAAAGREIRALTAEHRALETRIRATSPRYADLVQPEPLDAAAIRDQVLDPDTLLLQYSLGERASWLWAVTRQSLTAYELPPRVEIEARARRIYEALTARNLEPEGESPEARARRIEAADAAFPAAAADLAAAVLGPAAPLLAGGAQRLVVVADGALHYVPFAALPAPGSGEPLLFRHEVVSIPSASALAVLRRERVGGARAAGTLAVLADPVFDAADPRVRPEAPDRLAAAADPDAAEDDGQRSGDLSFRRLRFSRREAEAIAELVPEGQRLTALDFAASREVATGGALSGYRMVHFATHGVLDTDYPALSGLVLSLIDEHGEPREGYLRLHDIYGLDLDAELVTLSACETALGREIRGEGLVGLARGFMYAGTARVVASLWSVQDRATAETMRRFYQGMLEGGRTPASALRAAQISMAREERWAAPYYWAPFVLHGEWR